MSQVQENEAMALGRDGAITGDSLEEETGFKMVVTHPGTEGNESWTVLLALSAQSSAASAHKGHILWYTETRTLDAQAPVLPTVLTGTS